MNLLAVLVVWYLTGTAPAFDSAHGVPCPTGCQFDAAASADSCTDLASLYVVRHRQSATYVAHRAAILANPDSAAFYHAKWTGEAAWQGYGTYPFTIPGGTFTIAIADTSHGWEYAVCAVDRSGNQSCVSNQVAH